MDRRDDIQYYRANLAYKVLHAHSSLAGDHKMLLQSKKNHAITLITYTKQWFCHKSPIVAHSNCFLADLRC